MMSCMQSFSTFHIYYNYRKRRCKQVINTQNPCQQLILNCKTKVSQSTSIHHVYLVIKESYSYQQKYN